MSIALSDREKASKQKRHWVRLTYACNNNCVFCLDKEARHNENIPIREIEKDLRRGIKAGCERVILSGGEATIHPDFFAIVKLAKKMGYRHIQVISNGRLFAYKKFLNEATSAGIDEITFSIHGHTPQLHDQQTGVNGSFEQAITGLRNALNSPQLIVSVDIVINKMNYEHLADMVKYFIYLGVSEFDLLQVQPAGNGWENRDQVMYDVDSALPFLHAALEFSKQPGIVIWTNRLKARYLEGFEQLIQSPKKLIDEVRGRSGLFTNFVNDPRQQLSCRGEKCAYCFMEDFCKDLMELKENKHLAAMKTAKCLVGDYAKGRKKYELKKDFDIGDFVEFFINHRYFLKGGACRHCLYDTECDGAWIEEIRKKGFGIMAPITAGKRSAEDKPKSKKPSQSSGKEDDRGKKHVEINIGKICNNKCIFCKGVEEKEFFISADKIKKEIDDKAQSGYTSMGLLGGEPTIYPGINDIISYGRQKGFTDIHIITNGRKLADKEFLHDMINAGASRISVSIHSHLRNVEDMLTSIKGGYDQKIVGLKNLVESRINNELSQDISINIVVNRYNYREIDKTIMFFKKMGLREFRLNFVRPEGRCFDEFDRIVPLYSEFSEYIERILQLADNGKIIITIGDVPLCMMPAKIRMPELMGELNDYFNLVVAFNECDGQVGKETFSWIKRRQNDLKAKGPDCRLCKFNDICEGIWKVYADNKGFSELKPIR